MRGTEKDLVIIDREDYIQNRRYIKNPTIVKVLRFGRGWIDVRMSNGFEYKRSGGSIAWRYCNPGNIKWGKFARTHGAIGKGWGRHSVFPSYEIGRLAKKTLLFTPIRKYYNLSVREALGYYAPFGDWKNNPNIYTRFVVARVKGITAKTKLKHFSDSQQEQMWNAMQRFEGFKTGKIMRIK